MDISLDDTEDYPGRLLHQAALWDNAELLEDLLNGDHITHLNSLDSWGRTPLHDASMNEKSKCLGILLSAGANPNIACGPRGDFRTPLHVASERGHSENLQLLLDHGANILVLDSNGLTPMDIAEQGEHAVCMEILRCAANAKEKEKRQFHLDLREACSKGDIKTVKLILEDIKHDKASIVNASPNGANTLLFKACEEGHRELVELLIQHGADGRIHPVTKYSPLYITCYYGRRDIVELLLQKFPHLIQVPTVESWLPIHACCINGHADVLELLLKYNYPEFILQKYRKGDLEYWLPFDVNAADVSGNTILYLACYVGNYRLVELLLDHKIPVTRAKPEANPNENEPSPVFSPTRHRISRSISSIMSKLNLGKSVEEKEDDQLICPIDVNCYCSNKSETSLYVAVKNKHMEIVQLLLANNADPNLKITLGSDEDNKDTEVVFTGTTALVEACLNRDYPMVDLLLKYGARDEECKALYVCSQSRDDVVISKLLALKAFKDPEMKINKKALDKVPLTQLGILGSVTYSSLFPTCPVMINWHKQTVLTCLKQQWLIDASLRLNPKLAHRNQQFVLSSITRLDVSNNSLTELPPCIFQLPSIRTMNLAQNKIECLPQITTKSVYEQSSSLRKSNVTPGAYYCPMLEELYLQDNRLEELNPEIFKLPSLCILDVSNNKLQTLPLEMWSAPKLKEVNASLNLLTDLPIACDLSDTLSTISDGNSSKGSFDSVSLRSTRDSFEASGKSDSSGVVIWDGDSVSDDLSLEETRQSFTEKTVHHHNLWKDQLLVADQLSRGEELTEEKVSQLMSLNLSHNGFTTIPRGLACLAGHLTRLNLSYNNLSEMSSVSCYPLSLKQLDLSHNQLQTWFTCLPDFTECLSTRECKADLTPENKTSPATKRHCLATKLARSSCRGVINCVHRRHTRLENLRTLLLADNNLKRIQIYFDDDPGTDEDHFEESPTCLPSKSRVKFPNLSMLDVSNNALWEIPSYINVLSNLSVLNVSGNSEISELPPEMGLLSRLWNLNTKGCRLQEPLKTMIESKKYKTMDVIGYLKSILEDARPYARMKLMIVGIQGIGKTSLLEQLRQEGTGNYKKKPPEHWAKRMGNKNINCKTSRGTNISTVGVDIGDWVYEKKVRGQSPYGPVVFRTWDFGGQREYYATHQYFLSRRSLYLVVWKITDGEKGIYEILQWLVNIQARAPNSPVLIIGTHYDEVRERFPPSYSEDLQQLIRDRFINIVDADKCGLPRVIDSIEVSCKTRHNIRLLCNIVYDTVFSLKSPGSKDRLLEQKIPATYLALEDAVSNLAAERKAQGKDPVMHSDEFRNWAFQEYPHKFKVSFRDLAELNQAVTFLHENGVLLHYEDATLKDLYFLDPQWLCDMLAHVVTIREINPFARNGLMRLEDLKLVFKPSSCAPVEAQSYIVSLLNKFEVALTWDSRTLLIPSLLPNEEQVRSGIPGMDVRIPVRSRGWALKGKGFVPKLSSTKSGFTMSIAADKKPITNHDNSDSKDDSGETAVTHHGNHLFSIRRLLLMSYFPSGFWPRLLTRLLADDTVVDVVRSYFCIPREFAHEAMIIKQLAKSADWVCTQTGLELRYADTCLFRIKELLPRLVNMPFDYRNMRLKLKVEGNWVDLDPSAHSIMEIYLPNESLVVPLNQDIEVILHPNPQNVAKLLAMATDHVDTLLEDWYPTLGTRFVHTSEGKFLITRLIPCPACLVTQLREDDPDQPERRPPEPNLVRHSRESYISDCDSGVGGESLSSSPKLFEDSSIDQEDYAVYCFMIEECILTAHDCRTIPCRVHGDLPLEQIAPDMIFMDLADHYKICGDRLKRGKLLGRGAFGFVYRANYKKPGLKINMEVAMKLLQPVDPGPTSSQSAVVAYKGARSKWDRDPLQYSCKAYCTARQELAILMALKHPNIVPLVGICTSPLALILELAPMGALDHQLRHYRRSGAKLALTSIRAISQQVARALEYLHQQHIIYRDLKSENVLVWRLPQPFTTDSITDVRLADYGISRSTLPTGTKGFGGTEGFMAPEVLQYNGEEEYTEKVDCFSFGMFLFELLTLHQPFEGHESVKEYILEGGRPALTPRECEYPPYILDLMTLCWSQNPKDRPSASQIVSITAAPEYLSLSDVMSLEGQSQIICALPVVNGYSTDQHYEGSGSCEIWLSRSSGRIEILNCQNLTSWDRYYDTEEVKYIVTAMCVVNENKIWFGTSSALLLGYCMKSAKQEFMYALENDVPDISPVCEIYFLQNLSRVVVALKNGRIFLCRSDMLPISPTRGEGSFVLTELGGCTDVLFSMTTMSLDKNVCEIWSSHCQGTLAVFHLEDNIVTSQDIVNHTEPALPLADVLLVRSGDTEKIYPKLQNHIWTYVFPGCTVYQWDAPSRTIKNRLDCSKLVPCSESIKSISIDEHLSPDRCHVTTICCLDRELYIGTAWGCVIVAEAATMLPLTVFRPFEEEVRCMLPVFKRQKDEQSIMVTIGKGYRNLIGRYTALNQSPLSEINARRDFYAFLWRASDWFLP